MGVALIWASRRSTSTPQQLRESECAQRLAASEVEADWTAKPRRYKAFGCSTPCGIRGRDSRWIPCVGRRASRAQRLAASEVEAANERPQHPLGDHQVLNALRHQRSRQFESCCRFPRDLSAVLNALRHQRSRQRIRRLGAAPCGRVLNALRHQRSRQPRTSSAGSSGLHVLNALRHQRSRQQREC